ncbi:MAG: OmpH family outer membrane protein [Gemmatimonadaceae bacterium]|nr:OmpH family outer membrane protein [Gemmatimonadaceae bacterium]
MRKNNRYVTVGACALVALAGLGATPDALAAQPRRSAPARIGIVDVRVLLDSAPAYRDAETAFALEATKARALVAEAADSLKRAVDAFSRESDAMTPARREATLLVLRAREITFEDMVRQLEVLGDTRRRELRQPADAQVQAAITAVRRRDGYTLVLDRAAAGLVDADEAADITALVLAELRRRPLSPPPPPSSDDARPR